MPRLVAPLSIVTLALALLLPGGGTVVAQAGSPAPDARPDIVIVYLDDVTPHDGRLWSDPARTPTLARLFVESGTTFSTAITETPLCCPGRASVLTGLHTANHGVDANVATLFDPRVTIATELRAAGYRTIFVGKYMNGLRSGVPRRQVRRHAAGWDEFDVIYEEQGRYYDYDLWTRSGIVHRGRRPTDHSTQVAARLAARHLRSTPPGVPAFAFVSLFDLHEPNRPTPRFEGDPRCADIDDWAPPNFNEADVSDKPAFVRDRDPLPREAWPMRTYCEGMMGVDRAVARIVREQGRRGRLDDTLFIFTADNGTTWGAHRLGRVKAVPYAEPVPLAMTWPARWGVAPRTIDEPVSNIDMAPTLCEIGGCAMGPFPDGPDGADGVSLLPLLDGDAPDLGRDAIRGQGSSRYWTPDYRGLRTTALSPLGRWHYVEYDTGERELYDVVADPWELENLAASPEHAGAAEALAARLRVEFPDLPPRSEDPGPDTPGAAVGTGPAPSTTGGP